MLSYASPSSKELLERKGYDVFMSFRGEDTRMGFTSHLYDALTRNDIRTYKDDKTTEIGNPIAAELLEAIETSRFAVVVFSSSFATSKWCLEETVKIVDCMKRDKLTVIPVFYHVSPSHVRYQSDWFEQGFANHKLDPEIAPEKVHTWRAAMTELGVIAGLHVTQHRNESEVISEIVRKILKDMPDTSPIDLSNGLVGIESRVDEVKQILRMDSSEVIFTGICGMSGIGKTTLAEVVYKDIQNKFEKSSFIENIKDISKQNNSNDLCKLQQKLLDDILKEKSIRVQNVTHGQTLLSTKLRGFKVIIVLDDVNHFDQLTYLVGGHEWFGPGTRIVVTTTNADLLKPHTIREIYVCEEMKGDEALRLFCQSAFKNGHPANGYEKLSDDIVKLAGGLPLALNVYGSLLCGKEESYWKEMLKKLREYPEKEVLGRLEVVYARLDRDQRDAFIFIACFLKGRNIELVKDILSDIGLYSECGINDLKNKFLITINVEDNVWMHDLLQQMCWEILRKEAHRKHIAIKYHQDIVDALSFKPKGTQMIEVINQEPYKIEVDEWLDDPTCFSKMRKLKFLRVSNIHFHQGLTYLSNDLRVLEWYGCSLKSLPSTFEPKHIYELEMCCSHLKMLWEKDLDLPNLRSINLSFSKNLIKIPDLTSTLNLVKLNLEGCTNLTQLHKSVLLHNRLRYMNLKGCTHLQSLGRSTMEMKSLEALLLSGCSNLEYIPEFGQNMKRLEHLFVDGTAIKKLPDSLGKMCNLRILDASGTSITELPSSTHAFKKLRLLHVNRCRLSFKMGSFLCTNLYTISSGLREVDLSYCNLSLVPDGIGMLCSLISLDLSGNEIVSLPASISLLSKLRMLCLNNCKRLQSLPKLSLVDEDTDYGPRNRFNYYVSAEEVNESKFNAVRNNSSPTVSCLNCPKLAENESGSYLAEKILNNYLQLRSNHWITPEAVFEIVGAGRKIPSRFKPLRSDENLILEGPWIGVAMCAVISVQHIDAYMEAKYVITVHIHVGQKHWSIPVPVNFLVSGSGNQLLLYWTIADDFERTLTSWSYQNKSWFSFDVDSGDGNLEFTKFGVQIIREKDIQQLKQLEDSSNQVVKNLFRAALFLPTDLQLYIRACEADKDLHAGHSNINDLTSRMINFILDNRRQQYSLDDIHKILKCLHEINQEVFSNCKEEWTHPQLFPLVYECYRISQGTSELYNDFVKLLKDIPCGWLSVKLALEQIVAKIRAGSYTNYKEMLEQLNDLEAPKGVRLSNNFVVLFAYICKQTVNFSGHLNEKVQGIKKFKSLKVILKASRITTAAVLTLFAMINNDNKPLQEMEMKDITLYSTWLHLIQEISWRSDKWFTVNVSLDRDLCISDFYSNAHLLQTLKNKMARFNCFTSESEKEIMMVIDMLQENIASFSLTINKMISHAQNFTVEIRKAGMSLHPFLADGNYLQVTKHGVQFICDKDIRDKYSVSEAMNLVYRAAASCHALLPWYVCACGSDTGLHSCHSVINDHTSSQISFFIDCRRQQDSLYDIWKSFVCLKGAKGNYSSMWRQSEWFYFVQAACHFHLELARLLKSVLESWLIVKLKLEEIVVRSRADKYNYKMAIQQLIVLKAGRGFIYDGDFAFVCDAVCKRAIAYIRQENIDMVKAEEQRIIAGVLSVMAAYVGDSRLLQELKDMNRNSMLLDLVEKFSRRGGEWFDTTGKLMRSNDGELQMWDSYGYVFVGELKKQMDLYDCFNQEIEKEMVFLVHQLQMYIENFSTTIEDMYTLALNENSRTTRTPLWVSGTCSYGALHFS